MPVEKISADKLKELEEKHKRVHVLNDKDGEWQVVFRRPNRAEYKRFKSQINSPDHASDAAETLARQLVVHPSPEAFDALLDEFPGIPEAASRAFLRLAGAIAEFDGK